MAGRITSVVPCHLYLCLVFCGCAHVCRPTHPYIAFRFQSTPLPVSEKTQSTTFKPLEKSPPGRFPPEMIGMPFTVLPGCLFWQGVLTPEFACLHQKNRVQMLFMWYGRFFLSLQWKWQLHTSFCIVFNRLRLVHAENRFRSWRGLSLITCWGYCANVAIKNRNVNCEQK